MKKVLDFMPVETPSGTVYRPIIVVRLEHETRVRNFEFLLDSGADYSLLSKECAEELGMDFDTGKKREVKGISHSAIHCVEKKVSMTVPGFDAPFESMVLVSRELRLLHNLLGRDNFFIKYRIGLDQKEKKLVLDDRK